MGIEATAISEHMEVLDAMGAHVGTVDKVEGDRIKLTKNDPAAGGEHHYVPVSDVDSDLGGKLRLKAGTMPAAG